VVAALTLLLALLFGAVDQYLGSLITHGWGAWTVAVSQMSAPWLLLPFLAGMTRPTVSRGIALGIGATYAGLLGYLLMTLSPLEGVSLAQIHVTAFLHSQADLLVGGALTGPGFGWLGARWGLTRTWWCPAVVAACACLEPLARAATDRLPPGTWVWTVEVAAGLVGALLVAVLRARPTQSPDRASTEVMADA
jgi:hypothetical protein